jgi:hypothetical protein
MTAVPLGRGAYKRLYTGGPEVKLLNRWLEANPANIREGTSVIARPGTTNLMNLNPGGYAGFGAMRGNYALSGLFSDSLFVACGENLYRIHQDMSVTQISGILNNSPSHPEVAWQKGIGYERLWISDGLLLQYYAGTTAAHGTLTKTGTIVTGTDTVNIAGTYYKFGTTFSGSDAGTSANPFIVNPLSDPMNQLVKAVQDSGTPGTDYSSTIGGHNTLVMAAGDGNSPVTTVTITALSTGTVGNTYALVVTAGTGITSSGATLTGGGIDALQGCPMPNGLAPSTLAQVSSYILVGVTNSQQFYWINPGATTIDPLNFASKESSPDPITHIRAVGDQVMIFGEKSTENWYATGNLSAPFAPIEGRVYQRGAITGTPVVVDDGVFLVGDDGRVYSVGFQPGDSTDAGWGVQRVSNNGIEERVRRQIRREAGLNP